MPLLLPQQRYPQERGLAPEEPAGCPECLISRHCFANYRTYSAVARWSLSYSGEEHVPAACQLTLGCAGTRNENPDKGSDYITQAPSSTTRPAGQLRRPSDAISLAKSAFLPGDHVQTFSFKPTPRTPSSGFRNLTRMLPITAQSQSRLKAPRQCSELWNPPAYNSNQARPPPTNATVTGPCGKGRRWHTGAVRACLHELCQGQVQMHVWRSCRRMREVRYYYCAAVIVLITWPLSRTATCRAQTDLQYKPIPSVPSYLHASSLDAFSFTPCLLTTLTHPILGVSACKRTASHQCRIASAVRKKYQGRGQLT